MEKDKDNLVFFRSIQKEKWVANHYSGYLFQIWHLEKTFTTQLDLKRIFF